MIRYITISFFKFYYIEVLHLLNFRFFNKIFNDNLSSVFAYGNSYGILVLARALHGSSSAAIAVSGMSILAKKLPKDLRARVMPLAFGGIALGVLIGYPLGGTAYQLMGKTAPFLLISFFISINIGKLHAKKKSCLTGKSQLFTVN